MRLVSRSYIEGQHLGRAMVEQAWLAELHDGLIALSGAGEGDIGQALLAGQTALAEERLSAWKTIFPNRFYLELVRTKRTGEEQYIQAAVVLADELDVPVVATNDSPSCVGINVVEDSRRTSPELLENTISRSLSDLA